MMFDINRVKKIEASFLHKYLQCMKCVAENIGKFDLAIVEASWFPKGNFKT